MLHLNSTNDAQDAAAGPYQRLENNNTRQSFALDDMTSRSYTWASSKPSAPSSTEKLKPGFSAPLSDITPELKHGKLNDRPSVYSDMWLWEVASGVVSILCLAAIFAVLVVYERHEIPRLPLGITINALVSILATFSKSALLLGVTAAIGQYKWIWYRQRKGTMETFSLFEDASRGPVGALTMLIRRDTWCLATLGAFVVLTTLAVDPIVQQVLSYRLQVVMASSDAAVTNYVRSIGDGGDSNPPLSDVRSTLSAALLGANTLPQPHCPSGNCTWPAFESTSWCSKCTNVKDVIEIQGCNLESSAFSAQKQAFENGGASPPEQDLQCTFTIPGGWSKSANVTIGGTCGIGASSGVVAILPKTLVWPITYDLDASEEMEYDVHILNSTFDGLSNPLLTFAYLSLDFSATDVPPKDHVVEAYTCSLTPCVQTINLSVMNGVPKAEVLDTDFGTVLISSSGRLGFNPDPNSDGTATVQPNHTSGNVDHWYSKAVDHRVTVDNTGSSLLASQWQQDASLDLSSGWANSTHWVNLTSTTFFYGDLISVPSSVGNMASIVSDLTGNATHAACYNNNNNGQDPTIFTGTNLPSISYSAQNMGSIDNATSFPAVMSNVAAALTLIYTKSSPRSLTGSAGHVETYVEVKWPFLSLPIALIVLGNCFLAVVIWETKRTRTQIWKNSALAMIYHGYREHPGTMAGLERISTMAAHARGVEVGAGVERRETSGLLGWR